MDKSKVLKQVEELEITARRLLDNAHRLLDDAATLKEELSGGSGSSNSVLSQKHKEQIISRRRKTAFKK